MVPRCSESFSWAFAVTVSRTSISSFYLVKTETPLPYRLPDQLLWCRAAWCHFCMLFTDLHQLPWLRKEHLNSLHWLSEFTARPSPVVDTTSVLHTAWAPANWRMAAHPLAPMVFLFHHFTFLFPLPTPGSPVLSNTIATSHTWLFKLIKIKFEVLSSVTLASLPGLCSHTF